REEGLEHVRSVPGLLERNGRDLDVGVAAGPTHGVAVLVDVVQPAVADRLEQCQGGSERVFPPPLQPLKKGAAVEEVSVLVVGVEPEAEAQLLVGEGEGAVVARRLVVDAQPAGGEQGELPAEGVLGEDVARALIVDGPGWSNKDRLPVVDVESRLGGNRLTDD